AMARRREEDGKRRGRFIGSSGFQGLNFLAFHRVFATSRALRSSHSPTIPSCTQALLESLTVIFPSVRIIPVWKRLLSLGRAQPPFLSESANRRVLYPGRG